MPVLVSTYIHTHVPTYVHTYIFIYSGRSKNLQRGVSNMLPKATNVL